MRPAELLAYATLGIVGAFAAVIFAKAIGYFRPRLRAWPRWTQYFQPALAAVVIGLIGFLGAPQVMGAGYEYMDQAMHDQFTWKMLAILAGSENCRDHLVVRQRHAGRNVRPYPCLSEPCWEARSVAWNAISIPH